MRAPAFPSAKEAARRLISDITIFSRAVIRLPLRPYQIGPLNAILESIFCRHGREFLLVFPRQSGKNEAVAQLLVYLLNVYRHYDRTIVYAALGDTREMGLARLDSRLENVWNAGHWVKHADPDRRLLGKCSVVFLSTHSTAVARGQTAHHLLVIDEAQDQDPARIESVFTPMRAANNATAVYIGTVKSTSDFLWQKKRQLEQLEREDGARRVFLVTPEQVSAENPDYARFLAHQVARYGRHHPIIASEYFLEPIDGTGGLFDARRRTLLHGSHPRQQSPTPGRLYVATLDLAGEDEGATDPIAKLKNPARDYTACTMFEVVFPPAGATAPGPTYRAVDIFLDHGSRHFGSRCDAPESSIAHGPSSLVDRLTSYLAHWQVAHLVADSTGVGQGVVSHLRAHLGEHRVTPYDFSKPKAKAQLGSAFLALIETNRFKYWSPAQGEGWGEGTVPTDGYPLSDEWWFYQQAAACSYEVPPEGTLDANLRWGVPASHRTQTPVGPQPTHDDRLISAALVAEVDRLIREGKLLLGSARSEVIATGDPVGRPVY
jgi:hypothetical protein